MSDELTNLFLAQPVIYAGFIGLFALFIGSFLNVVIFRLPVMMQREWRSQCRELMELPAEPRENFNLATPRSRCPHCGHMISALENIPVLSFLMQRGRCRHCDKEISSRYPLIELFTALLSMLVAWKLGFGWQSSFAIILTWVLIVLTFIDIDHQLLPDDITLPVLWLGLGLNVFGVFTDIVSAVIGGMAGYLSLWLIYHLFRIITGKEGMGYGDFKLFALFGAWFGWQQLPLIILLSSLVGTVIGLTMIILLGRDRQLPIPFGPYLAGAGWIAMLWGNDIVKLYLNSFTY